MSDLFINGPSDDAAEADMPLKHVAVPQRPKTAHAVSNVCASRPGPACRPQSARAGMLPREHKVADVWQPAGIQGIADISKTSRPATAAAPHNGKKAALAALKAQLSDVAAGSNMQLQSLRPSMAPVDASAALHAQVSRFCCYSRQQLTIDCNTRIHTYRLHTLSTKFFHPP